MLNALLGFVVVAAGVTTTDPKTCGRSEDDYCAVPVVYFDLSYAQPDPQLHVQTAIGEMLLIEFPETFQIVGDPLVGSIGTFTVVKKTPQMIAVWPHMPSTDTSASMFDLNGLETTLTVKLDSAFTVLIRLKIVVKNAPTPKTDAPLKTDPKSDSPPKTVSRIVFSCSERQDLVAYAKKTITEERAKLEAEYKDKNDKLYDSAMEIAEQQMADDVRKWAQCSTFPWTRMRAESDLLVVWAKYICRLGNRVYISFRVLNRRRGDTFHLNSISVLGDNGTDMKARWTFGGENQDLELGMNDEAIGIAYFTVEGQASGQYMLGVTEEGGKKRQVSLEGLKF